MLILVFQLGETVDEKEPILNALGVDQDLRSGWSKEELASALSDFDLYQQASSKERPGRKKSAYKDPLVEFAECATLIVKEIGSVDRSLVDILRLWITHHGDVNLHQEFRTAAGYLEVELKVRSKKKQK